MGTVFGFVLLIALVVVIAAFGMWFAQRMAARMGRRSEEGPRFEEPAEAGGVLAHHPSPDGRYDLVTTGGETTGAFQPSLVEVGGGRRLLVLTESWSADEVAWSEESRRVTLRLRHSSGAVPGVTLTIDVLSGEAQVVSRAGIELLAIAEAARWLERYPRLFGV